jgi:hypothetical protein
VPRSFAFISLLVGCNLGNLLEAVSARGGMRLVFGAFCDCGWTGSHALVPEPILFAAHGALSFVLVSRFCAAVVDFRLVSVWVAFGGLAFSALCRVRLFLFSVPVGLCSCVAFAASAVFCFSLRCWVGSVSCVCLSVSCFLSSPFLRSPLRLFATRLQHTGMTGAVSRVAE